MKKNKKKIMYKDKIKGKTIKWGWIWDDSTQDWICVPPKKSS